MRAGGRYAGALGGEPVVWTAAGGTLAGDETAARRSSRARTYVSTARRTIRTPGRDARGRLALRDETVADPVEAVQAEQLPDPGAGREEREEQRATTLLRKAKGVREATRRSRASNRGLGRRSGRRGRSIPEARSRSIHSSHQQKRRKVRRATGRAGAWWEPGAHGQSPLSGCCERWPLRGTRQVAGERGHLPGIGALAAGLEAAQLAAVLGDRSKAGATLRLQPLADRPPQHKTMRIGEHTAFAAIEAVRTSGLWAATSCLGLGCPEPGSNSTPSKKTSYPGVRPPENWSTANVVVASCVRTKWGD